MDLIKDTDFRKELNSNPRSGYLFFGDEDYLKSFAVKQARELICPDPTFAFFNEIRLSASEISPRDMKYASRMKYLLRKCEMPAAVSGFNSFCVLHKLNRCDASRDY